MSRVRILNLPNDCTEDQLRTFFTRSPPPSAPPLEVTDVAIKRAAAAPSWPSSRQRGGGRGGSRALSSSPPSSSSLGKIRMAFVGFRNAAAGNFVVQYYNQTYFRSAKITVELAKGLNDVGITINMQRKMEAAAERREAVLQRKRERATGNHANNTTSHKDDDDDDDDVRRRRDGRKEENTTLSRREQQKAMFVDERTKATEGPSWAAEVLLPDSASTAVAAATQPSQHSGGTHDGVDDDHDAMKKEEEDEAAALARQQELGEVDDMAFLAGLATDAPAESLEQQQQHNGDEVEAKKREESDEDDDEDATTAKHTSSSPRVDASEAIALDSCRIRLGNIPYISTEEQVKQFASSLVGPVAEVHVPLTKDTRQSKGAAFIRFEHAEDAVRALQLCRGAIFMGRLLRVSAAEEDPHSKKVLEREARLATTTEGAVAGSSDFKKTKAATLRQQQQQQSVAWNALYVNSHAAVETVAQKLGVRAGDVVGVQAKGAAVRAAIAEAYLTGEVQQVLSDEGVAFDVLEAGGQNLLRTRSNTTLLIKNLQLHLPDDATELTKLFTRFGPLETSVFPSSGTFALLRFTQAQDARVAFARLSYKLFKQSPLYLEWAPVGCIVEQDEEEEQQQQQQQQASTSGAPSSPEGVDDGAKKSSAAHATMQYTLFITNLPFTATEEEFMALLLDTCPRLARDPDRAIQQLVHQKEHGRVFLTLRDQSTFAYCMAKINGKSFGGRTLACVASKQTTQQARAAQQQSSGVVAGTAHNEEEDEDHSKHASLIARKDGGGSKVPHGRDPLKLVVKNLPFEATEKDVRELFAAFSEVRSVRVPQKRHAFSAHRENNHRGFAFVEFMSEAEAARAMATLSATHLYGRHLVLEYAKLEED